MNKETTIFFIYILIAIVLNAAAAYGYSQYGAPAEFGNADTTTCWIGGDDGIANCTGTAYFAKGVISNLTGTADVALYWNNLNNPSDLNYLILSYWKNITNRITHLSNLTDDIGVSSDYDECSDIDQSCLNFISNCSADASCVNVVYESEIQSRVELYDNDTDTTISNCSIDQSCANVIYTSDKLGNTSAEILAVSWSNVTAGEWITPSHILDVDKEDIESDLNTFVDIAGDVMAGNLDMDDNSGQSPKIRFINELNNISEIYEQTDGDLYIKAKKGFELVGSSFRMTTLTNCDTIDTDGSGVLSCGTDEVGAGGSNCSADGSCPAITYDSEADTNYVSRNTWTDHDSYPAACSGGTPLVTGIGDTLSCTAAGAGDITAVTESGATPLTFTGCDTGSCAIGMNIDGSGECSANYACTGGHTHDGRYFTETECNTNFVSRNTWTDHDSYPATCAAATPFIGTIGDTSTCRGFISDTSPQLGGYLDTAGQNIGSTTDEIENIYIATNSKIYLGNGQEGEIYYDGTKLVIKI